MGFGPDCFCIHRTITPKDNIYSGRAHERSKIIICSTMYYIVCCWWTSRIIALYYIYIINGETGQKGIQRIKVGTKIIWICMCGLSNNQPFCDHSHKKTADEEDNKTYAYEKEGNRIEVKNWEVMY